MTVSTADAQYRNPIENPICGSPCQITYYMAHHNPGTTPDTDYACGNKTYSRAGYSHNGTDYWIGFTNRQPAPCAPGSPKGCVTSCANPGANCTFRDVNVVSPARGTVLETALSAGVEQYRQSSAVPSSRPVHERRSEL